MTKGKRVLSLEEHSKAEEERARHFRIEITDVGHDTYSLKSPILISKNRLELLKTICEITGKDLRRYVEHALLEKVQIDLENPNCFGQSVCQTLVKQWGTTK